MKLNTTNKTSYNSWKVPNSNLFDDYYDTYNTYKPHINPIPNIESKYLMHDIIISYPSNNVTEIRWHYKIGNLTNQQIHRISKNIPFAECTKFCNKIQTEWGPRLQAGETLEDIYMESLL